MSLATIFQTYRSKLVSDAGLVNLKATHAIADLPASKVHKGFKLSLESGPFENGSIHGGAQVEYTAELRLEIHWDPELDEEAIYDTIATDLENANLSMLRASNRTGTTALVVRPSRRFTVDDRNPNDFFAVGTFEVRYRLEQNLT